jgi:hypothetical protein
MKQRELIRTPIEETAPVARREIVGVRRTMDELGAARCPLCKAMLVARQGRRGPVFFCRCATVKSSANREASPGAMPSGP